MARGLAEARRTSEKREAGGAVAPFGGEGSAAWGSLLGCTLWLDGCGDFRTAKCVVMVGKW